MSWTCSTEQRARRGTWRSSGRAERLFQPSTNRDGVGWSRATRKQREGGRARRSAGGLRDALQRRRQRGARRRARQRSARAAIVALGHLQPARGIGERQQRRSARRSRRGSWRPRCAAARSCAPSWTMPRVCSTASWTTAPPCFSKAARPRTPSCPLATRRSCRPRRQRRSPGAGRESAVKRRTAQNTLVLVPPY